MNFNLFVGMSYLLKKNLVDSVGGFAAFGNCLAEDFFMSEALYQKGYRFEVAAYPAKQNFAEVDLRIFKDRLVRWSQLRLNMIPFRHLVLETLGEPLSGAFIVGIILYFLVGLSPIKFCTIHFLCKLVTDYILLRLVQGGPLPFSNLQFLKAWFLWLFLYVYVTAEAVYNAKLVKWGTKMFRLTNFGEIKYMEDEISIS